MTRYSGAEQIAALLGLFGLLCLSLVCIGLVYLGYIRLAAWLLCGVSFVFITVLMCIFDGIRSSTNVGYFVIVAAVSIFIRGRAPLFFMGLNVVAFILVYAAEQHGLIVSGFNSLPAIEDLLILSVSLVLSTLLLRQLIEGLSESVADAQHAVAALQVANEELKQSQASLRKLHQGLEARVAERTTELQIANAQLQHEVAERKRTEEAMQQAQKRESMGLMASGIAHDFNNLLVAMLVQTNLAISQLPPDVPARANIHKAVLAAEQAADLTRQMLAYAGGGQLEIAPVNLNQVIENNVHLFRAATAKNVSLHTDLADDLPLIEADRSQLQQVIMNLILNGAEAIEGVTGHVWLVTGKEIVMSSDARYWHWTGSQLPEGEYVCLTIRDSGKGMTPEIRSRMFDPFFTTKVDGQGLGLASVLGIVRDHRGGMHVESQPGQGTMFRLLFPRSKAKETAVSPQHPKHPAKMSGQLILVIDDEKPVREAIVDIMELHDVDVLTAVDGREGISVFSQHREEIQLVVLDMSMPGMNGIDTLHALRQIDPEVRVILSSGYSQQQIAPELMVNGRTGFLAKPYDLNTLVNKIWQYLPHDLPAAS